jgi:hypothetical protein
MSSRFCLLISLFAVFCARPLALFADVIASTLPSDNSYCLGCGNAGIGTQTFAIRFDASTDAQLGEIEVAVALLSGPNQLLVSLATDDDGSPGNILESLTAIGQMKPIGSASSIVTVDSILQPTLVEGDYYWIEVSTPAPFDTMASWYSNDLGISGTSALSSVPPSSWSVGEDTYAPAYRVISAVPEPRSFAIIVALFGVMGILAKRQSWLRRS